MVRVENKESAGARAALLDLKMYGVSFVRSNVGKIAHFCGIEYPNFVDGYESIVFEFRRDYDD